MLNTDLEIIEEEEAENGRVTTDHPCWFNFPPPLPFFGLPVHQGEARLNEWYNARCPSKARLRLVRGSVRNNS